VELTSRLEEILEEKRPRGPRGGAGFEACGKVLRDEALAAEVVRADNPYKYHKLVAKVERNTSLELHHQPADTSAAKAELLALTAGLKACSTLLSLVIFA